MLLAGGVSNEFYFVIVDLASIVEELEQGIGLLQQLLVEASPE